ncbi:type II restriction endonuclease [Brachyspira aalborgi]|uniref:site-specific DNA-methyltransferase (adenine-specific) n=1 Tax=Brachyspira aalborgi TaxID=29522 RepID=A0A5C8G4P5_9SPIR|nr:Eco57I restriction-modification methylase domain-containing protein [Brachyspira aalborgi]TXJ56647.1 type II restriction endonuclease [Brachyspira aalborgi]
MSKDFFRFDKEYSREEWTKYLGDNFKYEYGSIPNQNSIIEKYIDCLDDSNNRAIVWLGNLNVDEDIGVYEIRIKNTKTGSRVKISKICTDIIKSGGKNSFGKGIFFILYSNENEKAYRISYVKYDKKVNENFEVKKDLSDPKRFTYLLGEGAKVKTAQSRLNKEAFSSVKKIEEAFSVEPVNKEFYKGIKISFDKIYKNVLKNFENETSASDCLLSAKEFSLRFLGRALFCWFLREKDLIPKEIFDFINIDETKTKDNYYKEVLEELFFNILNVKMEERKIESKIINKYEKQIPFLNGGLFLKKEEDYKVKTIDNEIIKELFEFFEKYNFTVDESAPFDIEISIDPEMLGRIFENLLAEINPESSASARKETGSFYTPREIVDYMVCESIKLYLYKKTQNVKSDKIDNIFSVNEEADFSNEERNEILNAIHEMKILDIACGSGAFPMGILNRVFNIIDKLDSNHEFYKEFLLKNIKGQAREEFKKLYQANKFNYAYKLDMLQRMIHGVDIQPIAIEISRLRAFLSLIVDEEKESGHENLGIKALPNLEFNFISANSLISLEHKEKEQKELKDGTTEGFIKSMRNIAEEYFNADSLDKKKEIKHKFDSLQARIINENDFLTSDDKKKFLSWNPFENKSTDFFDSEIQFGTKFFDIVIGNPPYGAKISAEDKKYFKENYKYANQGSLDTYKIFIEKGFNLLDKNGNLNFIVPMSVTSGKSNIALHKMILDNCKMIRVSSYNDRPSQVFNNAHQKISIIGFLRTDTKCKELLTTKINRRYSSQSIDSVIKNLNFVNSLDFVQPEAFCKIGLPIEKSIMQKLYSQKQTLKDLMGGKQKVYYRNTGDIYYDLYTSYSTTKSTTQNSFKVINSKSIVALMSSTLFWWFRIAYTEGRHSYMHQFERFPIPNFSKEIINKLEKLGKEYETDIEKNHDYSNGVKTYKIRKSKHIIDKIDRLICPLYGLTEEEMEFIIGYELEFRV